MTPNLFVATQTLFSPHKWFKSSGKAPRSTRKTEHWDSPIPGTYEYIPGRGWYLVATDKVSSAPLSPANEKFGIQVQEVETIKMTPPVAVKYSKVVKRYFLAPDYEMRKQHGKVLNPDTGKYIQAGFFQLDDGIAWVQCWDSHGQFIPGPYKLWCIDQFTGEFRHMLKGDDPEYIHSRTNSFDREPDARRRSTESRSTVFRSAPGSTRDGPSAPSTRANSIRNLTLSGPTSHPGSQPNSRRPSPKRSPSFPLADRLREVAAQQAASARTSSDTDRSRSRHTTPTRHPTA
ncbi:hypothetical protein BDV96DRAFT_499332 [Lophiotrema nucula]|uniref:Uncharacterized protein n=1 Tax=Lophiotrema nucula TaxID=690887 RepID=A0A6A5YX07_9PLEO|nr:hypothetical protein BDV96DRAFT_499332 [Lophiotrema nucula]